MNPANWFTLLRILISPAFPIVYLQRDALGIPLTWLPYILLILLLISECSDYLDGVLARSRNEVTDLGKVLDPMADSITHISLFLTFTQDFVGLPLLLVLVFLYRDFFITTLRTLCAMKGVVLAARWSGKVKAAMQGAVAFLIILLMIPYTTGFLSLETFQTICLVSVVATAGYTVFSVFDYIGANWIFIKRAI